MNIFTLPMTVSVMRQLILPVRDLLHESHEVSIIAALY